MATTKFFLDMRGQSKDGKGSILIRLYHNSSSTTISTGIRIFPDNWSRERVVYLSGAEAINANLQEQKMKIDKAIALLSLEDSFDRMSASDIKKLVVSDKVSKNRGHLMSSLFEEYISSGELKEGTKAIYRSTLKKIISFSNSSFRIEDISLKWLRSFDMFLSKSQGTNGKAMFLRSLRAVCNYARHNGISFQYAFDNFHIKQEETQKRSINVSDLQKFYKYPTSKENSVYRDYFFLMFYLIGINTKDLLLAKKSQVVDGRLEYIREKTGKRYSIKIEPEAKELLDRYEGKGEYLLEAMDHCKLYRSFSREINDAMKNIGPVVKEEIPDYDNLFSEPKIVTRIEPVIPGLTTYYARHTWATLAYEIGIPLDIISQALGHSFGNRTTVIYVKFDQQKVDEANRKVIDYLHGKITVSETR